ncbi:unnamed protein product [Phyllotreta striolata]|uniref:Uncharacterized protein n=1 Tax=Phyllotreta striolata TaxID=444603 RepID=A0A9N9TZZ2_PHYSR|nr:unnamed protein product [Phyllotreta striolata]
MYNKHDKINDVIGVKKKHRDDKRLSLTDNRDNKDVTKHRHHHSHRIDDKHHQKRDKSHSPASYEDKNANRKRHHSTDLNKPPHRRNDLPQKSNTFVHNSPRRRSKSSRKSQERVSDIWYCQVETNSPFKKHKKDFEINRKTDHRSLKETSTLTNKRDISTDKRVLNALSSDVRKSKIHHFKAPTTSTVIKAKQSDKSSREKARLNKKTQHKSDPINLEQKIEDGLKIYFAKLQSIIDKKFEAILPTKKDPPPPDDRAKKPRRKDDTNDERKHRKLDKQTATITKRDKFVPERDDDKPIIKKIMDGDAVNNPSTSVMYVKPPPFGLVYDGASSKCIDLYGAEAPEERRRRRRSDFWVEGVEPAKRDAPVAPAARKPAPNLQTKILSIVGIPSQTGDCYRKKPFDDLLENKHKLKRFKLYYRYLQESNACNSPSHVPSESCKVLSDRSDRTDASNPPAKNEDNTYINIKLDDYHFYLKDKDPICLGEEAKKRRLVANKIAFNAKSDTDISYSSLNTFDLNKTDDVTLQEFYCNIDYFKRSFEKSDNRLSRFQVMQFLENMHQLYLVSQRKRQKPPVRTKDAGTNTDKTAVFVNKSVEAAIVIDEKIDKTTSYKGFDEDAVPKNDSEKSTSTFVVGKVENNSNTTTVASEVSKSDYRLVKKREKALQSDSLVGLQSVAIPLHQHEKHSTPMQSDPIVEPQRNKTVASQLPENFLTEEKSRSIALQLDYIPENKMEYTDKIKKKHLKTFKSLKLPKNIPLTPPAREAPEITDLPKPTKTKQKKPKEPTKKDDLTASIITLPSIPEYKDTDKKKKRCSSAPRHYQQHKDDFNFKLKRSQSEIDFKQPDKEETFDLPNDSRSRSHTKAHSLDRYLLTSKPILNEHAYNSTLMITKEYRSADVSSYHKRKKYDEAIRRKMKKKMGQQEKQPDRVFEVRYVTLDGRPRNAEALERIPESRECLNRGGDLIGFVNCLCASLKAKRSSAGLRKRKSDTKKPVARKKKTPRIPDGSFDSYYSFPREQLNPTNASCPALKASDSSFDFLYPDESESGEEARKRPANSSILGFTLTNDEIAVGKRSPSLDSPCSETSGYASSRSKHSFTFTNFFKKPKMAALLKPQLAEGVFGKPSAEDVFLNRSISSANISKDNNAGFCQSAPLCRTLEQTTSVKRFSSDTNLLIKRENSLPSDDSLPDDSDEYSLLEKMVDSDLYVANLSSCSIVLVESSDSIGASKAPGRRSSDVRRLIGKKFFENIVEMYENESAIGGGLYDDGDFVKELTSCGRRRKLKAEKRSLGRGIRRVLRKVLPCNGKKRVEKREPLETAKPVENGYQKKLQALAHGALKYFSSLVQAVAVNNKLDDELKMYGILRLLQAIENGQFKFLRKFAQQKTNVEGEVKEQIRETFTDVYAIAKCEASNCRRKLSSNDSKLMAAFACKYRIGLLSRTDVIASCLGKGLFQDEDQLKAAVIFLLKTTSDFNREEFEEYYRKYTICCL